MLPKEHYSRSDHRNDDWRVKFNFLNNNDPLEQTNYFKRKYFKNQASDQQSTEGWIKKPNKKPT